MGMFPYDMAYDMIVVGIQNAPLWPVDSFEMKIMKAQTTE